MNTNLFITTQLVKAERWPNGETVSVVFDKLSQNECMRLSTADFDREFFAIDRAEVGFGLVLEGMRAGLKFRRLGWAAGVAPLRMSKAGEIEECLESGGSVPCAWLRPSCLVANDWVVVA